MLNFSDGPIERLRSALNRNRKKYDPDNRLTDEELKEQEVFIKRFHPPETGWFGLTFLATTLHCCIVWGVMVLMANNNFDTVVPGDRWWRAAVLLLCYIVMVYRGRWLAEREGYDTGFVYWILKIFAWIALARFSPYVANPSYLISDVRDWFTVPITFFSTGFLVHLVLVFWSVIAGEQMGLRLLKIYVRPEEVFADKGGSATGTTEVIDHGDYYRHTRGVIAKRGVFLPAMVVFLAALSERPANDPIIGTLVIFTVVYVLAALVFMSALHLRYLRTMWQLSELPEPAPLTQRWPTYLVFLILLTVLVAVFLPTTSSLPTFSLNWDFLAPKTGDRPPPTTRPLPEQRLSSEEIVPPPFQLPDWFFTACMLVLGFIAIVLLIWILRNIKWFGENRPKFKLPRLSPVAFLRAVGGVITAILEWLQSLFKPKLAELEIKEKDNKGRASWFSRFQRERLPSEPREQVRFYYRQTLRRAGRVGLPRKNAQTPKEYTGFLHSNLPEPQVPNDVHSDLDKLNATYEQARFSPHPVAPDAVAEVAEQSGRINANLRKRK